MSRTDRTLEGWVRDTNAEMDGVRAAWAEFADTLRAELARREAERRRNSPPEPLRGLSRDATTVLAYLHQAEGGRAFLVRLQEVVPDEAFHAGLIELLDAGLVKVSPAVDEDGEMREVILSVDYGVDLPGTE